MPDSPSARPSPTEHAEFHARYVDLVPEVNILEALTQQIVDVRSLYGGVAPEHECFRYAEGKWSLREVVGHLADTERILTYRALCFARNERQALPGFEEDDYVAAASFEARTMADLLAEWEAVRQATISFYQSLTPDAWLRAGISNRWHVSVRASAYITVGHARHHERVVRERYLPRIS